MVRMSTTTESPEDMSIAANHYGVDLDTTQTIEQGFSEEKPAAEKPAEVKDSSKPAKGEEPGAVSPDATDDTAKLPSDLESEEQAQEKGRKKLLRQVDKLTGRAKTAETALEAERQRVAELERKLAEGKKEPVVTLPEPVDEAPKRPARPRQPRLEQFEYDQAKYESALEKYENETVPAYEDELSKWTRAEAMRDFQKAQAEEAERQTLEREAVEWNEILDAHDGLREKLQSATDVKVSGAMDSVLRTMVNPETRALILGHFVDNPEEAAEMMQETISQRAKPTREDWEFCTARASYLLAKLEARLSGTPEPKKPGPVPVKKVAPAPVAEVPVEPVAPAKPKPPVSAAPTPIEPVGSHPGAGGNGIADPNIRTSDYFAIREQERLARRRARG